MESSNNKYKFIIAKDKEGHMMLSVFAGDIDPEAVKHAKYISPGEFAQALAEIADRAKE